MAIPPSRRLDFSEIPVIDLGPLLENDAKRLDGTIAEIGRACSEVGFMYVTNHGVPRRVVEAAADLTHRFFALPLDDKLEVSIAKSVQFRGYLPMKSGGTKAAVNHREGYIMREERPLSAEEPMDGPNVWPSALPAFQVAMQDYFAAVWRLGRAMIPGFALALGLPRDALAPMFDRSMSQLKLNFYPAQDKPEKEDEIGIVGHADSGAFTILWQDNVGGLEVMNKSGEWVGAPPMDDTFVINIADILQAWSNGRFSSTPHRVINRYGTNRISIPLFVNPNYHTMVKPLVGQAPPDFQPFVSGEYQSDVYGKLYPSARA